MCSVAKAELSAEKVENASGCGEKTQQRTFEDGTKTDLTHIILLYNSCNKLRRTVFLLSPYCSLWDLLIGLVNL